jgi:hypothetical protein
VAAIDEQHGSDRLRDVPHDAGRRASDPSVAVHARWKRLSRGSSRSRQSATTACRTPRPILDYIEDFDAALDPEVAGSNAYDFRVFLIPQQGPRSDADVGIAFVRLEDLDLEHRDQVEHALTIIREKQVPVANVGQLLPAGVVQRVRDATGLRFTVHDHATCWRHYEVRPAAGAANPERTKLEFCRWDSAFGPYTYTEA